MRGLDVPVKRREDRSWRLAYVHVGGDGADRAGKTRKRGPGWARMRACSRVGHVTFERSVKHLSGNIA